MNTFLGISSRYFLLTMHGVSIKYQRACTDLNRHETAMIWAAAKRDKYGLRECPPNKSAKQLSYDSSI
mgnify:CR=1 FL=1